MLIGMSLPHYSPSELKLLVKHLQPEILENFEKLDDDKRRFMGSVVLTEQAGGGDDMFQELRRGHEGIRAIAKNLIRDIRANFSRLQLAEQDNEELTEEVRNLKLRIRELEDSCSSSNQRIEDECNKKKSKYEEYLDRFSMVQGSLSKIVAKIRELSQENSPTLNVLSQYGDFSQQGYEKLWQKMAQDKTTLPNPNEEVECDNVDAALGILEKYANPQLYQRILDDFEDISGTVRVYVRILNRSKFDDSLKVGEQKFNHIVGVVNTKDENGLSIQKLGKQRKQYTYQCGQDKCPAPPSVERMQKGRFVRRTKYPCNDRDQLIPFEPIYGPFFSVFENDTNEVVYKGTNRDPGIMNIINQVITGTDVVLFSYGLSGSGKTFSLLGAPETEGMVQMSINELLSKGARITLTIDELYGKLNPRKKFGRVQEEIKRHKLTTTSNYIAIDKSETIGMVIEQVNKVRADAGRIKFTPNNPESSRSHLFLKFSIQYKDKTSMLTFIDMAGVEDPFIIASTFLPIDVNNMKRLNRETIKSLITDISNPNSEKGDSDGRFQKTIWPKKFIDVIQSINLQGEKRRGSIQTQDGWIQSSGCQNKISISDVLPVNQDNEKIEIKFNQHCDSYDDLMKKVFIQHFRKNIFKDDIMFAELFDSKYSKSVNVDKLVDYIWDMLQEGYYINETLNHLRVFLLTRMNKPIKIVNAINYPVAKRKGILKGRSTFATITSEQFTIGAKDTGYTNDKMFTNPLDLINSRNTSSAEIKMIPLLRSLFKDDKEKRPKFVMMVNVRTDLSDIACSGTASTLNFANSVKST